VLGVRPRRRIAASLALLAAIAVVAGVVAGAGSSSPKAAANSSGASSATTVERRDLVETDTESGTLSFANPRTVYDRLGGTITWLPSVGRSIRPGQPLFRVNGQPVILMDGTSPAYRDLNASDGAGQDILELNRNLVALGFNPEGIRINDAWQPATTAGVDVLQASLGETETGSLSLGQVVFLPGDRLISAVDATLGSTGGGSSNQGSPSSPTNARDPVAARRPEFVSLETKRKQTEPNGTKPRSNNKAVGRNNVKTLQALIALLQAEIAELNAEKSQPRGSPPSPRSGSPASSSHASPGSSNHGSPGSSNHGSPASSNRPSTGGSFSANSDAGGGNASAILQTTSTQLIVTVDLDASKQSEAKVGEPVTVELPAGNTVDGRITAVSPIAQCSSNSNNGNSSGNGNGNGNGNNSNSSGSTIPVTITLLGHHAGAGLDQASVSVNLAQARANNVLSVPVTALLATAGGGYAVQEAAAPHNLIPVTTGLFAAGYVEISGSGIYPGLRVTDSQG
jgi:hypothetical protein